MHVIYCSTSLMRFVPLGFGAIKALHPTHHWYNYYVINLRMYHNLCICQKSRIFLRWWFFSACSNSWYYQSTELFSLHIIYSVHFYLEETNTVKLLLVLYYTNYKNWWRAPQQVKKVKRRESQHSVKCVVKGCWKEWVFIYQELQMECLNTYNY